MTGPSYPAARGVAQTVHEHFARHVAEARARGEVRTADVPDAAAVESMVDAAFWASLRREESYVPKISLAFLTPDQTDHPLMFEHALTLDSAALVRLAADVDRMRRALRAKLRRASRGRLPAPGPGDQPFTQPAPAPLSAGA